MNFWQMSEIPIEHSTGLGKNHENAQIQWTKWRTKVEFMQTVQPRPDHLPGNTRSKQNLASTMSVRCKLTITRHFNLKWHHPEDWMAINTGLRNTSITAQVNAYKCFKDSWFQLSVESVVRTTGIDCHSSLHDWAQLFLFSYNRITPKYLNCNAFTVSLA